jgi:hypothetical protein
VLGYTSEVMRIVSVDVNVSELLKASDVNLILCELWPMNSEFNPQGARAPWDGGSLLGRPRPSALACIPGRSGPTSPLPLACMLYNYNYVMMEIE